VLSGAADESRHPSQRAGRHRSDLNREEDPGRQDPSLVALLLAEAIKRISDEASVSSLFD
jgi:hypothetical protein